MTDPPMVFRTTDDGVLVAPADCSYLTVPDLISQVREWCATPTGDTLVVDLGAVEHLDTAALRSLVWARRYCRRAGAEIAVVPPRPGVLHEPEEVLLRALLPVATSAPMTSPVVPRQTRGRGTGTSRPPA